MEVEEGFESVSEVAGRWRRSDRMLLCIVFSFHHILFGGEGEGEKGSPYKAVYGFLQRYAGQGQDTVK